MIEKTLAHMKQITKIETIDTGTPILVMKGGYI